MRRLGYARYVAQGGDWGAFVVDWMGVQELEGLIAIHNSMPGTVPADVDKALQVGDPPPAGLSAEERRAFDQLATTFKRVDYARFMGSRPQTLYAIADSPVGLAAWLSTTATVTAWSITGASKELPSLHGQRHERSRYAVMSALPLDVRERLNDLPVSHADHINAAHMSVGPDIPPPHQRPVIEGQDLLHLEPSVRRLVKELPTRS
jgi:hypothetical protein